MARTSADITIHRIDGTTLPVPITTEARRTWRLMREDNIRLRWDSATEYRAKVGDWIDDELFGKFYVTEEQEPTVDTGTGAYRHDIRLDRDYIGWKNVLHMLTYDNGTSRKETDWTLTDSLQNHLTEIVKGLRALGYSCGSPVVESSVENPEVAVAVTFSGTSVYDALNTLAGAYSCEWWVTYNSSYTTSTIHFGKRELSNTPKVITLGDNAEDITPSRGGDAMANRIFAFGSTRNIPETYRKTLSFQVTDTSTRTYDGQSATVFRDSARVVTRDMLKADESLSKGVTLALGSLIYSDSETTPSYKEMAYSSASFTLSEAARYGVSGELACVARFSRYDDTEEDGEWSWLLSIDGVEIASGGGTLTGFIAGDTTITVNISESVSEEILLSEGSHTARLEIQTLNHHFSLAYAKASSANITLSPSGYKLECPLIYNGNTYTVRFNPLSEPSSRETFNWFSFVDSTPSGFGVGSRYTLGFSDGETAGLLPLKTPVSFYSDDMGDLSSLRMVGARRLMLPAPGYVESGDTSTGRVVEKVVIFDNIFPKLYLQITDITEGTYTDNTEWSDGSRSYGSLPKYTIKVKRITSSGLRDFNFKRDYLTSDPLSGVFVTRDEARGHGSSSNSRFLLSGMTFGLNFNEAAQTYTIAFNEDYGAKLPNGTLKPEVGDALILTGWNVNAIESLGLVDDAEGDLLTAATTYLTAVSKPSFTWRCRMMSDSMMSDGLLNPGQRVRIVRGNLEDTTRVIGLEYKLDIPEDTPEYECGETEAYSRLRELEKALNAKTVNTASASGGAVSATSSSAGSTSEGATLSAVLSWQTGEVDPATSDTFDGTGDKMINIPAEIDHLSNGGLVPRIDEVMETLTDGSKVVRLVDGEGNTVLPSGSMDWFIAESYEEGGETKNRLKLNPKYVGMYAEGWVSSGGISDTSGGGGASYLHELLDVNLPSQIGDGQALIWDANLQKWTSGDVTIDTTPFERVANKVTSVSAASDNTQYPTAKAVYDIVNTMLSSAMRFQGVTTTALVDGSTTNPVVIDGESYTATMGDVVVRSDVGLEYLWTGAKWQQLGDETSYAKKTVTITGSGYLTGGGNLEAARTIDIAAEVKTKIDNGATAFGYFTDGAANEAIKLRTPRTIWGQSFDGTGNVSGELTNAIGIEFNGISANAGYGGYIDFHFNGSSADYTSRIVEFTSGILNINESIWAQYTGNVGIGTPTPGYKLDVAGDVRVSGKVYIGSTGAYFEVDSNGYLHTNFPLYSDSWVSSGGVSATGGSGAVGYLHDLLDVDDDLNPSTGQALVWDGTEWVADGDISGYEKTANKVTSISASSTDAQYPSAKAVHTALADYLPLAGGVMTGVEKMVAGATPRTSGSYLSFIHYSGSSEVRDADVSAKNDGFLGLYARNGIALRPGTGSAFDTAKGLSVTASDITFNDTSLINTYAKKSVTIKGSGYLSGGGSLEAARTIDIAESIKTKIDNGAAAYDSLRNYLPLAGGTMTNTNLVKNLNADLLDGKHNGDLTARTCGSLASYGSEGTTVADCKAWLAQKFSDSGYSVGDNCYVGTSYVLGWDNDAAPYYPSSVYSFIKIGGGYNGTDYGQWLLSSYGTERLGYVGRNANQWTDIMWLANTGDIASCAKIASPNNLVHFGNEFTFIPPNFNNGVWINYRTSDFSSSGNVTSYYFGNGAGRYLAYITDGQFSGNAASATKLETARTIWGQSFDGSKDVNGKFLFNNGDGTLKIYDETSPIASYGPESVAIQTAFDQQDPETSTYPGIYGSRCLLLLQPRGGWVGIGTTSPGALFHVNGPSGEVARISQVSNYTAGSGPELSFYNSGTEKLASVRGVFDRASGQYGNLLLGTRTSDAAGVTTKMTILYNGNVGIGTTPAYKLDVAGTVNINPSETAVPAIRIVASGNSANHGINYVDASGNIKARFGVNSSTGLFQIFANGDVTMRSGGTSTSGFTISSPATSGNVTSYMMYPAIAGAITLNSTGAFSALGNGADLASPGTPMRSVSTKVIYLASGIYIYYDTVHNCIRTNAPIVSDSYISAGGVSTT